MPAPFNYGLSQWGQSVKRPYDEWRRLASSAYVDASPGLEFVSTLAEFRLYVHTAGALLWGRNVRPINRFGECLLPYQPSDITTGTRSPLTQIDFFVECV